MKVDSAPEPGRWPGVIYRHRVGVIAFVIAGLAFLLYALTLAPGLTWRNSASDGGDLLAAAFTWGIPHPTGYPTYLIALRGFSAAIPFGSEALHGNLFSSLTAAAAVGLLFLATARILRTLAVPGASGRIDDRHISIAAGLSSLSMAASRELWSQATVTEVYALNALFVSAILLASLGLRDRQSGDGVDWRYGAGIGLLSGIALGNHLTIAALIFPMLAWGLLGGGVRSLRVRHVLPIALSGALGLGVYAYAPLASAQAPDLNWGHPDSVQGFWWMVSGTVYQGYAFGVGGGELYDRLVTSADLLFAQFAFIGVLLGLVGLPAMWGRQRQLVAGHLAAVTLLVVYAVTYRTVDSFIYLIPVFMLFSIWMAAGVLRLLSNTDQIRKTASVLRSVGHRRIASVMILAILVAVPGFSVATNYDRLDLSDDREASDYAIAAFETMEPGSIVFTRTERSVFSLWYQSYVAETERAVMPVSVPHIVFDWYWDDLVDQFPERMPDTRPSGLQDRVLAIIDHNLGINPLYDSDATGETFPELRVVEDGVLMRIEPG
ncbi:MAG: DUF2723 domain-containing protein [Dehalococcoidia bacterium]|nr:DUF2723 domain-containing protein [Dehalococcoidia bacterium]